jgi:hypothetical protein
VITDASTAPDPLRDAIAASPLSDAEKDVLQLRLKVASHAGRAKINTDLRLQVLALRARQCPSLRRNQPGRATSHSVCVEKVSA